MKKIPALLIFLFSLLISLPVFAASWRYIVYENGVQVYDGPLPPVDLTYPPHGEPTPTRQADHLQSGIVLTPAEEAAQPSQPQVIIVPPATTGGDKISGTSAVLK